jgi:cytochrome c-type biogenesis protein CcmE
VKPRTRRFLWIAAGAGALAAAVALVLFALRDNLVFFYTPTQIAANEAPRNKTFRLGGLVEKGSVARDPADNLVVTFRVTDMAKTIPVRFRGTLPDLFAEGRGIVAQGKVDAEGRFVASEVLAKHDEAYMPPEAAEALKKAGHPVGAPDQFRKPPPDANK